MTSEDRKQLRITLNNQEDDVYVTMWFDGANLGRLTLVRDDFSDFLTGLREGFQNLVVIPNYNQQQK